MFIASPNNYNKTPMMPFPHFYMDDDTKQNPMPRPHGDYQDLQTPPATSVVSKPLYNRDWLITQIGKYVKVGFLLGTETYQDKGGILQEVGISFIIIKEADTNDIIMCDMYSIKFVTVFSNQAKCMP